MYCIYSSISTEDQKMRMHYTSFLICIKQNHKMLSSLNTYCLRYTVSWARISILEIFLYFFNY